MAVLPGCRSTLFASSNICRRDPLICHLTCWPDEPRNHPKNFKFASDAVIAQESANQIESIPLAVRLPKWDVVMWRNEQRPKLNAARTCKKHTGHHTGNSKILNRTAALRSCFSMLIDFAAALFTQSQASFSALAFVLQAMRTLNVSTRVRAKCVKIPRIRKLQTADLHKSRSGHVILRPGLHSSQCH